MLATDISFCKNPLVNKYLTNYHPKAQYTEGTEILPSGTLTGLGTPSLPGTTKNKIGSLNTTN